MLYATWRRTRGEHVRHVSRDTDESAFEHGSLGKQVVLAIVTFGFYGFYWFHKVNVQVANGTSAEFAPATRTIGMVIPFVNLYFFWKFANDAAAVTDQDGVILFAFLIVFAPAVWFIIQSGINEIAE